jgi:hypothetical protein
VQKEEKPVSGNSFGLAAGLLALGIVAALLGDSALPLVIIRFLGPGEE